MVKRTQRHNIDSLSFSANDLEREDLPHHYWFRQKLCEKRESRQDSGENSRDL